MRSRVHLRPGVPLMGGGDPHVAELFLCPLWVAVELVGPVATTRVSSSTISKMVIMRVQKRQHSLHSVSGVGAFAGRAFYKSLSDVFYTWPGMLFAKGGP